MMKGGKDESRVMSPMFPRLHVNDTEKGGPRAPPRNKMALYEQLGIPSQRFNSGSPSVLPLPPNNSNSLVPSISSSHGGGNDRSMFVPFGNSHESSILPEKFHSYSFPGIQLNTMKRNQETKSTKVTDYQSLEATAPIPAVSKSKSLQPHHFSNFKKFSSRKLVYNDDLRVPTSVQSGVDQNCSCSKQSEGRENFSKLNMSFSMQLQTPNETQMKENGNVDPKSQRHVSHQVEENGRLFQSSQDLMDRSNSILPTRDKTLVDTSSNISTKIKNSESLKRPHASYNQNNKSSSADSPNAQMHHEYVAAEDKMIFRENTLAQSRRCLENASPVRNEISLRLRVEVDNGSLNVVESRSKIHEEKKKAMKVRGINRHNDLPGAFMVESITYMNMSPDDVVGLIGQKHFWKVRSSILKQQRIFAVQVFELHRVIKVQRLIAGSPHMLLEDTLYTGKPSLVVSPSKKLPSEYIPESPLVIKVKDNSQKPNNSIKCADENAVSKPPLPSADDTSKGLVTQKPIYGPYPGSAMSAPMAANTRPSPWGFSQPGSQWLVPVMSPSEGLVYKPYAGPCPPTAGFLTPVYGSCGPVGGDFLSTAYGVPASHQQGIGILPGNPPIGQVYFPHYGMPVRNPSVSGSAVEQMSLFTGVQSKVNQLSIGDVNFIAQQSSCNMSSQMSQATSYCVGKLPASKESEIQGSTASSPSERVKGDMLPLFPETTAQASDQIAQTSMRHTRVIKVVPHNPRLATESAARIFWSIQEERKQYD